MRKVFFALIFIGLSAVSARAQSELQRYEEECLSLVEKPKVTVTSSYGKLLYDFEKDAAFLKRETLKKYEDSATLFDDDFMPVGLTKVREVFDCNISVGQMEISQGYRCFFPTEIKIHLGYLVPTIYVMQGLEKDSCLYNLSLKHERTHFQIYVEALDYFLPLLKKNADQLFDKAGVKVIGRNESAEEAAHKLNDAYLAEITPKVDKWRKEVEAEQLKLDSPENYLIETKICEEIDAAQDEDDSYY